MNSPSAGVAHEARLADAATHDHQSDARRRSRLRWRARRGLLENDIILTRFLDLYEKSMSDDEVGGFTRLCELSDNELMDLILARSEPAGELDTAVLRRLVGMLRSV